MVGTEKEEEVDLHKSQNQFVWDETSHLYYHACTGFYHDPQAGWYYSCNDGLYYKFENGNYVPMEFSKDGCCEMNGCENIAPKESNKDETEADISMSGENVSQAMEPLSTELSEEPLEDTSCKLPENPPRPSEWLKDTHIELYLANYTTQAANSTSDITVAPEINDTDHTHLSEAGNSIAYELEEGEWIPDNWTDSADPIAGVMDEGICLEEENWLAQYGQVEQPGADSLSHIRAVDLWDWSMLKKIRKGRLVKPNAKMHPSMPSSGHLLKIAPVCEVHLDLDELHQVYRLRNPSAQYLASLSNYDSSNPTKNCRFPQMSIDREIQTCSPVTRRYKPICKRHPVEEDVSLPSEISAPERERDHPYRDGAAERRALHGRFGVGPGQQISPSSDDFVPLEASADPEEALSESLRNSFGAGSYARKILERMGWKEGGALGCSNKGLIEPLQARGNKGSAGLGWNDERRKQST
ncbi:unnamed protein product [Withania somnifera]